MYTSTTTKAYRYSFIYLFYVLVCRRKRKDSRDETITAGGLSSKRTGEHVETSREGAVYANIKGISNNESEKQHKSRYKCHWPISK